MRISLSPVRADAQLAVELHGDVLTVNGQEFDFTPLPDGATLPQEAIGSDWFVSPVERIVGELRLTLLLPHGPNPPSAVAFPEPITITADGPVELPQ